MDVRERRLAVVKQVAGVDHRVHVVGDGVLDHRLERHEKVRVALGGVVLAVPEMGVAGVDHPRHGTM